MAYIKVSQLPTTSVISEDDVIMIVDDVGGTPVSKIITFSGLLQNIYTNPTFLANLKIPVISNSGDNRILTSLGTSTGIYAESNLTFDGSLLAVTGSIKVTNSFYDNNNSPGTSGQILMSTANGIDWVTLSDITGVDGTGIANYTARWLDPTTIGTGILYDTGSGVGIGITSPTGQLQVIGTGNFDVIGFNTNPGVNLSQGQIDWNDTEGTLNVAITNDTDIHVGAHQLIRVRNATGSPLYKGQAVYASGVHSNGIINPSLFTANGVVSELRFIGLMLENLNNNNNGYVINFGHMENIDTRGNVASYIAVGDETWAAGDILYVHPTDAGKLTKVAPKYDLPIALVLDSASNGKLFVRPTLYGTIDSLHDVNTTTLTNGQFLQYNSASGLWLPSSTGNFTSLQLNGTTVSVVGHTHTSSNITDFNSSVSGLLPTISNSGDNRLLTSTGTNTGINAESNLSFDGTNLVISSGLTASTGNFTASITGTLLNIDNLRLDGNTFSSTNSNENILILPAGTGNVGIGTASPNDKLDVFGNLTFNTFTERVIDNGNSGTTKTLSIESGTIHKCTLTGNCVFTMPSTTSGKSFTLFLNTGAGNFTSSFSSVRWNDSVAPTITSTASKVDILSFISDGSYWYGSYSQNYG